MTFSCRVQESFVQLREPVQTASPSRTTYLWCIRSGTPAIAAGGQAELEDVRGRAGRRGRHGDRPRVVDVVGDPDVDPARGRVLSASCTISSASSRAGGRRARCRARRSARGEEAATSFAIVDGGLPAVRERPDLEHRSRSTDGGAQGRLVRPLLRLVVRERLRRVDIAEAGCDGTSSCAASTPKRFASTEPSPMTFIGAEAGEGADSRLELGRRPSPPSRRGRRRRRTRPRRCAQSSCTRRRHRAGEAVDRRAARGRPPRDARVDGRDLRRRRACRAAASA